jgi:mRNA interferase HigB
MLNRFALKHPDAAESLDNWYRRAGKARWEHLVDVRRDYPHADLVGNCTVFNVAGNKYRLVTWIRYDEQTIYTRLVITHAEYDKGGWKIDSNG